MIDIHQDATVSVNANATLLDGAFTPHPSTLNQLDHILFFVQIINHIKNGRGLSLNCDGHPDLCKLILRCYSTKAAERPTFSQILQELEMLMEEGC
jgi:hypothetical protein